MSDDQKIWFIYLTDHHEGPFTAAEIAEKAKAGLVNGQSLAWKDGMPEWVAAETIPELAPGMGGAASAPDEAGLFVGGNASPTASPGEAAPATAGEGNGEVSLAQLLAQSQQSGENTPVTSTGMITDSASVLSSMVSNLHANTTLTKGNISLGGGIQAPGGAEPATDDEVWTLKIGGQVSGLHSLRSLKELAASGEIPSNAMLWHPGWSDFQPLSSVPQVDSARKNGGIGAGVGAGRGAATAGGTRTGITRPGMTMSAQSNSALDHDADDEPTDTGIEAPGPGGFKGVLFKIHKLVEKRKRKTAKGKSAATKGKLVGVTGKKPAGGAGSSVKRLAILFTALLVLGGAAAGAYFFLFMSPIPSSVDVSDEDREQMVNVVTLKGEQGHKLYLAQARGTEESPPDPSAPKYYVASNLPEGTKVNLAVTGTAGTMVNKTAFEKSYSANVEKTHLATFDKVSDDGKPLWGEFALKVTAEGADPLETKNYFIGTKGAAYQKRLKTYKDSIQADYDKEIGELREYITTLKGLQTEASKQVADYKSGWATPALRTKITGDWANFTKTSSVLLAQLEGPAKARQPGGSNEAKFHGRAFQDVGTTVGQLAQLVKVHGERLAGSTAPSGNADEIDGLVQAGVQALEAWLAQAVAKTPFDSVKTSDAAAKTPAAPAPVPAASKPSTPAAPPAAASAPAPAATPAPAPAPAPRASATPPAAAH